MKRPVALPALLYIIITGAALASAPGLVTVNVQDTNINVYYYQPAGDGPFPLLVLSHGSPRSAEDRASYGSKTLHAQAEAYAATGVAVAVPIRRGYGGNGEWVEGYGNNKHPDFYVAGLTSAEDIEATIAAFSKRPEIDASRIVLMGVSAGGWASVAAGTKGGVLGVVSFAGGRGSAGPDNVPGAPQLIHAAALYGATSQVPELWIYSENDHFFDPPLAHQMFDAFTAAGGHATFLAAPAYGDDGHQYIADIPAWKPEVDTFLRKIGFLPAE